MAAAPGVAFGVTIIAAIMYWVARRWSDWWVGHRATNITFQLTFWAMIITATVLYILFAYKAMHQGNNLVASAPNYTANNQPGSSGWRRSLSAVLGSEPSDSSSSAPATSHTPWKRSHYADKRGWGGTPGVNYTYPNGGNNGGGGSNNGGGDSNNDNGGATGPIELGNGPWIFLMAGILSTALMIYRVLYHWRDMGNGKKKA